MLLIIKKIQKNDKKIIVTFNSKFGESQAQWEGDIPELFKEYDVEIEILQILEWDKDILPSDVDTFKFNYENNETEINCSFDKFLDDNLAVFRLDNNVFTVETKGNSNIRSNFFKIKTNEIILYNTNL